MKYKIKKYNLLQPVGAVVVALFLSVFASCEDQTVDLMPVDRLTDLTAFETPERCELAVAGVYDAAQNGDYLNTGLKRGYPFGAASIIQSEMRGEDMTLSAVFYDYTFSSTYDLVTGNNQAMWENSFACINRSNVVIEGINHAQEIGVLTEEIASQYLGECYFVRALTYHNLMIHFALPYGKAGNSNYGLPYYEKPHNTPESIESGLLIGRLTVEETYAKILADLNNAESLLPEVNAKNKLTRASKGAPIALKTRVYLHKNDWASVITEAKKIVAGSDASYSSPIGGYTLTATPSAPFVSYTSNTESIFSIENSTDDNPGVNGSLGQMMSARKGGRGIIASSPILYNNKFWTATDKRRGLLLDGIEGSGENTVFYCDKYTRPTEQDEYAPIIRYAEVLLNYSEALIRSSQSNIAPALDLLNAVRNRSVDAKDIYATTAFTASKDLLEAILWERRIEFMGEGRRWEDIHRLLNDSDFSTEGIPAKIGFSSIEGKNAFVVNGAIPAEYYTTKFIPSSDRRILWPIPLNDIVRNPTLSKQQNEGW